MPVMRDINVFQLSVCLYVCVCNKPLLLAYRQSTYAGFSVYISDSLKVVLWLKSKGIDHFNTTVFKEYDMGSYALSLGSYTAYDKNDTALDRGTYVFSVFSHVFKCSLIIYDDS